MKKSVFIVLGIVVVMIGVGALVVIGNGNRNSDNTGGNGDNAGTGLSSSDERVLVAYYSATGSTERVAKVIAEEMGADLFVIEPEYEYTGSDLNWSNSNSRVSREHNDESLRDIKLKMVTPNDWSSYDTVILGYPIWWGEAAWVVNNFIKDNDFSGKKIIPFCTSASSGLGDSDTKLKELSNSGTWMQGKRFASGVDDTEVKDWVKGLR